MHAHGSSGSGIIILIGIALVILYLVFKSKGNNVKEDKKHSKPKKTYKKRKTYSDGLEEGFQKGTTLSEQLKDKKK